MHTYEEKQKIHNITKKKQEEKKIENLTLMSWGFQKAELMVENQKGNMVSE